MIEIKSTIGDGHPDSKFAYELGALHKYEYSYASIYIKIHCTTCIHGIR